MKNAEKGIRINMKVDGEPAEWLEEWKRRGLIKSYTDAIIQSLRFFNEKIIEQDIKSSKLKEIKSME